MWASFDIQVFFFLFWYSYPHKERVDASESYTLDSIRHFLVRQEDSIIFSLLERAQYCYNADTYDHHAFSKDGFHGSLVEFMIKETEKLHAQVFQFLANVKKISRNVDISFFFFSFLIAFSLHDRWVDTIIQMSILSSRLNYLSQCFLFCNTRRQLQIQKRRYNPHLCNIPITCLCFMELIYFVACSLLR